MMAPWSIVAAQPAASDVTAVRVELRAASTERAQQLAETARRALATFSVWLGPYPAPSLTLVDVSWRWPAAPSPPGTAPLAVRWAEFQRDPAAERRLISTIASHYWHDALYLAPDRRWFAEALVRYIGARGVDTILEARQYWASRYFGGFIPYAVRSLPLSPASGDARGHIPSFDSELILAADSDRDRVTRATAALFTLERLIGWPALQQGLAAFRAQGQNSGHAPAALAAVLAEQRGSDLSWFFDQAFRQEKTFDYGVESLANYAAGAAWHVRLDLRRHGDGVFGADDVAEGPALPVVVVFADGLEVIERWPGGLPALTLEYTTSARAIRASVDPDAMLLLDRDPLNNVVRLTPAPVTSVGARATMAWLTWAENLMLTCLALV